MFTLIVLAVALSTVIPVAGQEPEWCRLFNFAEGQHGWALSYNDSFGRYTTATGFTVTDYNGVGNTSYDYQRSIRIHRDFSGTLTQIYIYATDPEYQFLFVDYNSEVMDGEPFDDDAFMAGGMSPDAINLGPTEIDGRLGLEISKTEGDGPLRAIVFAVGLVGTGDNPFGPDNCVGASLADSTEEGAGEVFSVEFDAPFQDVMAALAEAQALISSLPDDLFNPAGLPLLPDPETNLVFGYAKWLLSPAAADEYAGPFAPIIQHQGILIFGMFAMIATYVSTWTAVNLVKGAVWLVLLIFRVVDLILQALQVAGSIIGSVVSGIGKILIRAIG